ncbi:hypothetical protein ACET3Z_021453 [Daucus carota]
MDNSNSKRIDIVERAMIDANQNETNQNDDIFGTRTSAISDVVPPRRGRPRGRPRKVTEKSQETVKNNGSGSDVVGLTDLRKRGRPRHNELSIGAPLRRPNLGKEKVGVHCTPSAPELKGRKPFEPSDGLCKNLGASFLDVDPLSYCYSDADFENNDALIPDYLMLDSEFDDNFHYILEKPSDVESSSDSDISEFTRTNPNKDHILSQVSEMEMDMLGIGSDGETDPADDQYSSEFDGFSSDGYAGSFYSCGSESESQSDEEVQSEFPRGAVHYKDTNQDEIPESSSRRSNVFIGNRHLPMCAEYRSLGGPTSRCNYCNAQMWSQERVNKGSKKKAPMFSLCYVRGLHLVDSGQVDLQSPSSSVCRLLSAALARHIVIYRVVAQIQKMSGPRKYDSLDSLDDSKYEWKIRVRVICIWDSYSNKGQKEFKGRNMLLLDDKVRIAEL